jgi:hypothetical protein
MAFISILMANPIPDKTRYTYVYHPSRPHKERWEKLAAKAHTSLSKYIISIVDEVIDEKDEPAPRHVRELDGLKNEIKSLREDLQRKNIIIERYEDELKRYRAEPWTASDFAGSRRLSEDLVRVLKTRGSMDKFQLLEVLGIDLRETDLIKAISGQLETLEVFGMVKAEKDNLRWVS